MTLSTLNSKQIVTRREQNRLLQEGNGTGVYRKFKEQELDEKWKCVFDFPPDRGIDSALVL